MTSSRPPAPDPTVPTILRQLFRERGFRPRKSLGQTFLTDANIVAKIIGFAELTGDDAVVEIGPGAGAVTRALAATARRTRAVEIDPTLVEILAETVGASAEVIQGDVLDVNWDELLGGEGRWKVVANLPYAITGPAILQLLAARSWVDRLVIMVQEEVADRLVAPPGGRQRGLLSVLVQAACEAKLVWRVARSCFWPPPQVDSALLTLVMRRPPLVPEELEAAFSRVAHAGFGARRKTLPNALAQSPELGVTKEEARCALVASDIDPERRAETLSVAEFLRLTNELGARGRGGEL